MSSIETKNDKKDNTGGTGGEKVRSDRVTRVSGIDDEAWKTRVYENDLARMTRKHTWIGEEDDADKLRNAAAGTGTNAAGYETKVFEGLQLGRQYTQPEIEPPLSEQRRESEKKTAGSGMSIPDKIRSMRRIRIGDRRRFRRLLAVLALIVIVIVFEACFFVMEDRVSKLPAEIKNVQEQTADLTEDNKKLQEENENLGDSESKKELKESWERLRDKVKEAVGETSS